MDIAFGVYFVLALMFFFQMERIRVSFSLPFRNKIMLLDEKIKGNFKTAMDEEFYGKIYPIASSIF